VVQLKDERLHDPRSVEQIPVVGVREIPSHHQPDLQWTAMELIESRYDPAGATFKANSLRGKLRLVVSGYLTDTDNWYLFDTSRVVKPLVFQLDHPVEFQAMEKESDSGFMRAEYLYGTYARYNVGYGLWQCAFGALAS
jgi:phage major head subunit gpT-like protein